MNLHLNKREKMNRTIYILLCFLICINLKAEDTLDLLDKQSKKFFNDIIGLEKNYLEEQVKNIKTKAEQKAKKSAQNPNKTINTIQNENKISQEQYEKTVFRHENEMARLTSDFTKTKKLKDIKIKSMYKFNGKKYVVLKLDEEDDVNTSTSDEVKELSLNIEGRYTIRDSILTHEIVNINTQTKTVELYKKLDDEYGYSIYLSNYGISVSDLKKKVIKKPKVIKKIIPKEVLVKQRNEHIEKTFTKLKEKPLDESLKKCLYTVKIHNLNVRNTNTLNGTILRVLKKQDKFTIQNKKGKWVHLHTIFKKKSGDVMSVQKDNNWLQIIDNNVSSENKNCL